MRFTQLLFFLILSFFLITSCSSNKSKRKVSSEGTYRTVMLGKDFTLRTEDENGNLEFALDLREGDILRLRIDSPTSSRSYINDGDIFQSNGGWFADVMIMKAESLEQNRIDALNERQLFVSESILSNSLELREGVLGLDCGVVEKGCLLKRDSDTVVIFFRGWVPDNRFGSRKSVPQRNWTAAARSLMLEGAQYGGQTSLANLDLSSSIFTMGSPDVGLTTDEMDRILEEAGASTLIFASHSGGWKGLQYTITPAPRAYWEKVRGIWLLDNFYSTGLAPVLERNFGLEFLNDNCYAYFTPHNAARFGSFRRLCPKTLDHGVTHSGGVEQCLPQFEDEQRCTP